MIVSTSLTARSSRNERAQEETAPLCPLVASPQRIHRESRLFQSSPCPCSLYVPWTKKCGDLFYCVVVDFRHTGRLAPRAVALRLPIFFKVEQVDKVIDDFKEKDRHTCRRLAKSVSRKDGKNGFLHLEHAARRHEQRAKSRLGKSTNKPGIGVDPLADRPFEFSYEPSVFRRIAQSGIHHLRAERRAVQRQMHAAGKHRVDKG